MLHEKCVLKLNETIEWSKYKYLLSIQEVVICEMKSWFVIKFVNK
jgi:hypothetical protein